VLSSQSTNLKYIFEIWESLKYCVEVFILEGVEFLVDSSHWNIAIFVDDLEDVTDISEVAALLKHN
jgi:hypothetical protein